MTICVVGAAGGIGEGIARRLSRDGGRLALCDLDFARVSAVAADLGSGAAGYALDVRDADAVDTVVGTVESAHGPIDRLAVTVGVFRGQSLIETTQAAWEDLFASNVFGVVNVLRSVGRRMRSRGCGSIVVIGSQSSQLVRPEHSIYGASKSAVTYAAKCLGLELAPHGVRVNVIHPGVTETPMALREWASGVSSKEFHLKGSLEKHRTPIPLGRVGQPEDVAAATAFLLSDEAQHITIAELLVDGGSTLIA